MSVFDRQGLALGAGGNSEEAGRSSSSINSNDLMGDEESPTVSLAPSSHTTDLDSHKDARSLVRLVQCQQCSLPLRQPFTLPCGNSLCRQCLPETHRRENITYPMNAGWMEGFVCPFEDCGQEHSLRDSKQDVTLAKVLDRVSIEVARTRPITSNTPMLLDERPKWKNIVDSSNLKDQSHSRVLSGGRLVATYSMAELGELRYDSEVSYQPMPPSYDSYQHLDLAMLEHLRETTRNELDCNLCYALLLDPITTSCGHTYCRKCVARVLDHSQLCPECRGPLHMSPAALNDAPSNKRLSKLLLAFCAEQLAQRASSALAEEATLSQDRWVPLFVCTLAYPHIPTFLHIFEPRYRLMIRRAMETDRKFGMLTYNVRGASQGELGRTQFMRYGTMLEIVNLQLLEDGRSLIETRGVHRFAVTEHGMRDGYVIGRVSRIDDITVQEEEALEAADVAAGGLFPSTPSQPASTTPTAASETVDTPMASSDPAPPVEETQFGAMYPSQSPSAADTTNPPTTTAPTAAAPPIYENVDLNTADLSALPTASLMSIGTDFVSRMQASSAPWLSLRQTAGYGDMPSDPAVFPYWFASVLPIDEGEKYRLLMERSVRGRLMICAEWVRRVEGMRWLASLRFLRHTGSQEEAAPSYD